MNPLPKRCAVEVPKLMNYSIRILRPGVLFPMRFCSYVIDAGERDERKQTSG
jgi:hypothetical protein